MAATLSSLRSRKPTPRRRTCARRTRSAASAPFVLSKRNKIENADYRPEFQLSSMQKDLHLASVTAYETGVALPLTDSAKELYRLAMRNGHAGEDFSAIYGYLASNGNSATSQRSSNITMSPKPSPLQDENNSQEPKVPQQAA